MGSVKSEDETPRFSFRFQVLAILMILCCALSGASLGTILSINETNEDLVTWIALPGQLFIRALKCIILPLVFVNVIIAMIQLSAAGNAKTVGFYTIVIYMGTTVVASAEGLIMVLIFQSQFSVKEFTKKASYVNILCPEKGFKLVQSIEQVLCVNVSDISLKSEFIIEDINNYFQLEEDTFESVTLSQTLQDNVFRQMFPENIFEEFADFRFIGVIMFAIIFGAASQAISSKPTILINLLLELNDILIIIVEWIIFTTPFAVFSLIAGALAGQDDLIGILKDVGVLASANVLADILHICFSWPLAYYLITKTSPFPYMKFLLPAQFFGFAAASSAATLPVTLRCVKESGMVPDSIRDFVLPIGATINMDGIAIYFPPALVFLANSVGVETGFAEYFLIVIVATIGSAGTAPVPNGSLLMLLTAYTTVYGGKIPDAYGILFGIHWLMGRCTVVVSVTGDAMVARTIAFITERDNLELPPTTTVEVEK